MIPTLPAAPTLDGSLSDWPAAEVLAVDHTLWRRPTVSATARVATFGDTLYVAVEAVDGRFVPGAGIAGDHVEVWFADPAAIAEQVDAVATNRDLAGNLYEDDLFELKESDAALAAAPPWQQVVLAAEGDPLRIVDAPAPATARGVTVATPTGWVAEYAIPLTMLPRVSSTTLTTLALRVDVVDADGKRAQDGLRSSAPTKDPSELPTFTLAAPVVLGPEDPWTALGLPAPMMRVTATGWEGLVREITWPDNMIEAYGGVGVLKLPAVKLDPGPPPLRVLQSFDGDRVETRTAKGWERLTEGVAGADAWVIGRVLVTYSAEWTRGRPGPGMCGAGMDETWSFVAWEGGAQRELTTVTTSCGEADPAYCSFADGVLRCDHSDHFTCITVDGAAATVQTAECE